MNYEKMWNDLKEHIDTVKCRMYEEGFDEEYEEYVQFSEVVQEIENKYKNESDFVHTLHNDMFKKQ
ncbi:hypothetical protein EVU91_11660 [Macrococcoides bohemicum]|uniref:hypothetical protein n=1 Tax=Macrococcoides bohemicum TaxID=1903056 RepID=UPI0010597C00|nr:hypothetical protein [Macrococcus bohemicus]TDL35699.1 hypothetical protein EVU91_11660 [Macrococcus bohemicus]